VESNVEWRARIRSRTKLPFPTTSPTVVLCLANKTVVQARAGSDRSFAAPAPGNTVATPAAAEPNTIRMRFSEAGRLRRSTLLTSTTEGEISERMKLTARNWICWWTSGFGPEKRHRPIVNSFCGKSSTGNWPWSSRHCERRERSDPGYDRAFAGAGRAPENAASDLSEQLSRCLSAQKRAWRGSMAISPKPTSGFLRTLHA
jgi:hypothetical protein